MLQPPQKKTCEICNEFAVFAHAQNPHNFLVRTSTFKDIHTGLEVLQYVCSRCGEEWLRTGSGARAGWSLRRGVGPDASQLTVIVERRRGPPRPVRPQHDL